MQWKKQIAQWISKVGFSLQGFEGNFCVLCVNAIVYFFVFLNNLYVLLHLIRLKTYSWYQSDIWLQGDAFVAKDLT